MSPRELIRVYARDERLNTGRFFSTGGLEVSPGDHVGVVLMVPGAPQDREEVADYIYRRLMGPSRDLNSVKLWFRHFMASLRARHSAAEMKSEFDSIGGGTAIHRMNREQAEALQREIRSRTNLPDSVKVSTYIGSPFGSPEFETTAQRMVDEGVTHVLLFPLFPQYAAGTTGRGLAQWEGMLQQGDLPRWPTVATWEFATNDKYIEALNDRVDQALMRYPRHLRDDVHLLFAAHGRSPSFSETAEDPYCCLVHNTVDAVMNLRGHDRLFTVSFVRDRIWGSRISSDLRPRLTALKSTGCRAVLVIPVDYVSEQFDTSYLLDVRMREEADRAGIVHYHVVTGLNCHPLFIEAMGDMVIRRLRPGGTEGAGRDVPACPRSSWRLDDSTRRERRLEQRCAICPYHSSRLERAAERESTAGSPTESRPQRQRAD